MEKGILLISMAASLVSLAAFLLLLYRYLLIPRRRRRKRDRKRIISCLVTCLSCTAVCLAVIWAPELLFSSHRLPFSYEELPAYDGRPWVEVNGNEPYFIDEEITPSSYVSFSALDLFGRCGAADAVLSADMLPDTERGSLSDVTPSGWQSVKYDTVDGEYLYNRCHLIAFSLCGADDDERNLITGTRSMNINGMLDAEMEVLSYIRMTGNHVRYRVTPVFVGDELVARGVLMEAMSLEDDGEGICWCIYAYNEEPGIIIDYRDGTSREA